MFYFNSIVTGPVIEILRWLESACVPSIAIYQTKCISWEATLIHRHRPVVHLGESKSQFQLIITCTIRGGYARGRDLSKRRACTTTTPSRPVSLPTNDALRGGVQEWAQPKHMFRWNWIYFWGISLYDFEIYDPGDASQAHPALVCPITIHRAVVVPSFMTTCTIQQSFHLYSAAAGQFNEPEVELERSSIVCVCRWNGRALRIVRATVTYHIVAEIW